jgi:uncharacterized protein YqhQ
MALQRLTTREPSDAQVEVAIVALATVLAYDALRTKLVEPAAVAERITT